MDNFLCLRSARCDEIYFFHSRREMEAALAAKPELIAVMGHGGGLDADFPGVFVAMHKTKGLIQRFRERLSLCIVRHQIKDS